MLMENPQATIGDNQPPDHAREVTERMERDYNALLQTKDDLLAEADKTPFPIKSDEDVGVVASVVKRLRDLKARFEGIRIAEKEPYMRMAQAVDQFFFGQEEEIEKRKKTDKDGIADVLQARVHAYNAEKLAEERRRREEAERLAREELERTERARREAEQKRIEAEQAAIRARKQENIEARLDEASAAGAEAAKAKQAEQAAREKLRDASIDAAAKSADLMRTRHETGRLTTMKQVPYVEITDEMALDAIKLWPFVKTEHKLAAVRMFGKVTNYKQPMNGAIIEMRDETVIM